MKGTKMDDKAYNEVNAKIVSLIKERDRILKGRKAVAAISTPTALPKPIAAFLAKEAELGEERDRVVAEIDKGIAKLTAWRGETVAPKPVSSKVTPIAKAASKIDTRKVPAPRKVDPRWTGAVVRDVCRATKAGEFDPLNLGCRRSYIDPANLSLAAASLGILAELHFGKVKGVIAGILLTCEVSKRLEELGYTQRVGSNLQSLCKRGHIIKHKLSERVIGWKLNPASLELAASKMRILSSMAEAK